MTDEAIFPKNEVGQMADFVKQENARRKLEAQPSNPFPENEMTSAGLSPGEDHSSHEMGETGSGAMESGPPHLYDLTFHDGTVATTDGQEFKLPEDLRQQIVAICLKGLELATIERIKSMAQHHGLKIVDRPPPEMEQNSPDETLSTERTIGTERTNRRGRPRKT